MDSSSYGARAYMLGAGFGVRGHLTHLAAALRRMGAWHVKSGCWLLLLPPTQCVLMPQGTAGTVF